MLTVRAVGSDDLGAVLEPLRRGKCVLCLGGELAADGSLRRLIGRLGQLADASAESADARALLEKRPLMAADHVRRRLGDRFVDELRRITTSADPSAPLKQLGAMPFSAVLTTSYDSSIERAFARGGAAPPVFTPHDAAALKSHGRTRFVFKLLGDPGRPETVVWGAADVQAALAAGGYAILDELFRTKSFLLLGFDWADAELSLLLERLLSTAGRGQPHFAVLSNLSQLERDELHAIYGIRVLDDGLETSDLVAALTALLADPARAIPDDDDLDAWLALLADDPTRPEVVDRLDALEERMRRRGDPEKLIELWVGRVAIEPEARRRAELLGDVARVLEDELRDPGRALAARLASYAEAPARGAWEKLESLAAATGQWTELTDELRAHLTELPAVDQADAWARIAAIRDEELDDADGALAASESALGLDPAHRGAIEVRISVLRRTGRWKELSESLGRAVLVEDSLTSRAELYGQLAEVFATHLNDARQAVACWRLALEADPYASGARDRLEELLDRRGEIVELIDLLEQRILRANPAEQLALRRRIANLFEERLGDPAAALRHWEAVRSLSPADAAALSAIARLYEQSGRTRDLLGLFTDAAGRAESEKERADILRRLAVEQERQPGGTSRAAETWEALLEIQPGDAAALEALERAYRADGQLTGLATALERHLAVVPPEARAALLVQLGQTRESLDQAEHAHAAYLEALRLEPDRPDAFDALIRLYETSGAFDAVVTLCEERSRRSPAEAKVALLQRAAELARDKLGDAARAETLYAAALEVDPRHVPSLLGMHQLYRRQGDLGKAARLMVEAIGATQNRLLRTRLSVEVGELYERIGDPATALAMYRRALELDPDHVDAAERAVELLWRDHRWGELLPILDPLARREPPSVDRWARLGLAALRAGDRDRAQRAFRRTLELDPSHKAALAGLATLLYDAGAFAEAEQQFTALLHHHEPSLSPADHVEAYHRLGVCLAKLGRPDAAREKFAMAIAIDPTHRPSLLLQLELGTQAPAEVIEAKKALLATASVTEQVKLYLEIGVLYLESLEDPVHAMGAWEAGLKVAPDDVRLLHRCMNVLVEQKAWSQAMNVIDKLIRGEAKPPVRAKYHYTAGIICLEHLGRFADAADHLWAAVEGDPGYKRAKVALEGMLRGHKSWKELARFWTFSLKHLEPIDSDEKRTEQLRLWTELGELYRERLNDPEDAVVALEVARRLDPTPARRQRLATACIAAGGKHLPLAIAEHQALLDEDPSRVVSYRALKELYEETDQVARAEACALALKCLLPDEEGAPVTPGELPNPQRGLSAELAASLRHPDEDVELSTLFALAASVIVANRAQRDRATVQKKRLLAADDPRPFAKALRRASSALGVPVPNAYASPEQPEPAVLLCAVDGQKVTPVLSLGQPLLEERRVENELAFDVARRVAQLRPEHLVRYLLPLPHELMHLVEAAVALAGEVGGGAKAPGELGKTTEALKRQLPPPALDQVVALGHRLSARLQRDKGGDKAVLRWLQASDLTVNRLALVAAGDLPRSARMLKHDTAPPTALPAERRILDLLRASVGDPLFAARSWVS
jgi:tetratricopeptide (TPR) repeat protein